MKNIEQLKKHCNAFYDKKQKELAKNPCRWVACARVPLTPRGLKAEQRKIERERAADLARIDAAAAFGAPKYIKIKIEWHRSATRGYNPKAEAWAVPSNDVMSHYGTGRASGCGYDKESAAAAGALSGAAWDWLIFNNWRKLKKRCGGHPFYYDKRWPLPFYNLSGTGMSVLRTLSDIAGYTWEEMHGNSFDGYIMQKKHGRKQ